MILKYVTPTQDLPGHCHVDQRPPSGPASFSLLLPQNNTYNKFMIIKILDHS